MIVAAIALVFVMLVFPVMIGHTWTRNGMNTNIFGHAWNDIVFILADRKIARDKAKNVF